MILMSNDFSRRGLLRVAGALGVVAGLPGIALAVTTDPAQPGATRFSSVSIDTQPLADKGLPNYASHISKLAKPIIASVFADRLVAGRSDAPRLVLRISSVQLSSDGGEGAGVGIGPFGSADNKDWVSGLGEIVDGHGRILSATKRIDSSSDASGGGGADILTVENVRTQRALTVFAEWIYRYI